MSLKGQHIEPLAPTSSEFRQYRAVFGANKLVKLYKISYEPTMHVNLARFNDYPSIFYHGTGHCGCTLRRGADAQLIKINVNEWCGGSSCATQGILSHGHLMTRSRGGHFFSPNWLTAQGYSLQKSGEQSLLSMFLVKARVPTTQVGNICAVHTDMDILPCYLAILRYP